MQIVPEPGNVGIIPLNECQTKGPSPGLAGLESLGARARGDAARSANGASSAPSTQIDRGRAMAAPLPVAISFVMKTSPGNPKIKIRSRQESSVPIRRIECAGRRSYCKAAPAPRPHDRSGGLTRQPEPLPAADPIAD
ncbi:hypothetical protein BKD09_16555 [Bradyrhizobium japonicum]|uniref:Uncharacterized protein n=1 Tax=Bradyrhizobium japonicum TaxID=375 RepID=A0A1L3F9F7_BRAJP|nr:hypothetical protein BKD09_16555 [Bradyrhizobium japonicum]